MRKRGVNESKPRARKDASAPANKLPNCRVPFHPNKPSRMVVNNKMEIPMG